jgi:hypothetical protein
MRIHSFNWLRILGLALVAVSLTFTACKDDEVVPQDDDNPMVDQPRPVKEVEGILTGDITWSADTIYLLRGFVRIGNDPTIAGQPTACGTLTIEPGTLIMGDRETKGTLVVQRCSKIFAQGTAEKPIIMTSERRPGLKQPGDWGGLVVCGFARNNNPGGVAELEGQYAAYHGGTDDNDNSGIIEYVRIEYAGIPINPNQEVNSLTMGSVGRGTTIRYVACSYGLDDAFEWFGGTVDGSHLIAYRCLDDDLDVDNGFSGNVQFALVIRDRSLADQSGSNGFEVDNDGGGTLAEPFTAPTFSNVTVLGPKADREEPISLQYQHALHLRRSTKIKIHNSVFTGFPFGLYIDGANTVLHAQGDELTLRNCVLAGIEHWGGNGYGSAGDVFTGAPSNGAQHPNNPRGAAFRTTDDTWDIRAWYLDAARGNQLADKYQDLGISRDAWDLEDPKLVPASGASILNGASFAGLPSFFQTVNYRGAFGATDWTEGWMEWNPGVIDYAAE